MFWNNMMSSSSRWKLKLKVAIRVVDIGEGELGVWLLVS
jgi:hypothetical protein